MRFAEWVLQHPDEDAYDLAKRAVIDEPEMTIPVVAERVQQARRGNVRGEEHRQVVRMLAIMKSRKPVAVPDGAVRRRSPLLDQLIALDRSGDVYVTWGEATIEQLEARDAMLAEQIAGIQATRRFIKATIKRLRDNNASCLNEIADQFDEIGGGEE